jgi:putative NADH-flavin reductase
MKITVIGASAGIGLEVVRHALHRGHEVTSLSRHTGTLPDDQRLHVVQGSSTKPEDVKRAIQGAEAILVTLGTGKSTKDTTLFTDSARVLLQVLKDTGATPPLIVLTGFGAGDSWDYNSPVMKILFKLFLTPIYANKSGMERMIAQGYPRWEMVRPGRLTNGRMTGRYRVLTTLERGMHVGAISRADVAHFMVAEAESPAHISQYPALTY